MGRVFNRWLKLANFKGEDNILSEVWVKIPVWYINISKCRQKQHEISNDIHTFIAVSDCMPGGGGLDLFQKTANDFR